MQDLERIASLRKQLVDLGYRAFQIDNIYREAVDTCNIDRLSSDQYQVLIADMEEYISFANKCLRRKT